MKRHKSVPTNSSEMNRLMTQLYCLERCVTIQFICRDNLIRSPFAENYLKTLCSEVNLPWSIMSFGFIDDNKQTNLTNSNKAASQVGVDLSHHKTNLITQSKIDTSEVIVFIFDEESHRLLNRCYSQDSLFNLSHFIPKGLGEQREIIEPSEKDILALKHCYLLIAEALKNIFENYRML